jgi:hypothetical protein
MVETDGFWAMDEFRTLAVSDYRHETEDEKN